MTRVLLAGLLCALPACRCAPGPVSPVDTGFHVASGDEALDFGRVLEGTVEQRAVTLVADTRLETAVTLAASAPFDAPVAVTIPGGNQVEVPVTFTAGDGRAEGELVLFSNGKVLRVKLVGVGVRPPRCFPSAECTLSEYSLAADRCVETAAPDEAPCDPKSLCLERGRCRAGTCVGVARTCDDDNACTIDACDVATGCVYRPVSCPAPTARCRVATCDPALGCGEAPAGDFTPCGPIDCVTANVCDQGQCTQVATPEGFHCADPLVCLGAGACRNQKCERPDASVWAMDWTAPLGLEVPPGEPALAFAGGSLFFVACGLPEPAPAGGGDGGTDGGRGDGGEADGGDAGGSPDGGSPDAGAALADGGLDASVAPALRCGLVSYTPTGFERFTRPFTQGLEVLVNAAPQGLATLWDGGVRVRARSTGAPVAFLEGTVASGAAVARTSGGALTALRSLVDGGVELAWLLPDAGLVAQPRALATDALLALDEDDGAWTWEPALGVLSWSLRDGGVGGAVALSPASASLVASRGAAVVGAATLVHFAPDGGAPVVVSLLPPDAGGVTPLPRHALLGNGAAVTLHRRCEAPLTSCAPLDQGTFGRAASAQSGAFSWEAQVLPGGVAAEVLDTALVDFTPGTFTSVVRADFDAGTRAFLEVYSAGKRVLLCPLPGERQDARAALLANGRLFVLFAEGDGGHALQALPLTGLPLLESGWATPGGAGNTRRASP